jgi:hypothetical protein
MSAAQVVAAIAVKPTAATKDLNLSISAPVRYSRLIDWQLVSYQKRHFNVEL